MNYYERHLGDYARDTAHLSLLEHGVYTILLDRYYASEEGIPADQAHRVARAHTEEERQAVDAVLKEFFTLEPSGNLWVSRRVQEELVAARARIDKARENGKKGGRPPKTGLNGAEKTQTEPNPNPEETQPFHSGSENKTQTKAHQAPSIHLSKKDQKQKQPGAYAPACPPDVGSQVWTDWCALRKAKRAPITETVIAEARIEAEKAGMPFARFLAVWCRRGSQGLEANWLKPHERAGPSETKPSAAANFRGTDYGTTDIDSLPADMRDAVRRELGNG